MFRKHWTKIILALTSFFWAGCDDSSTEAVCLYGPDPNGAFGPPSEELSSDSADESSSSEGVSSEQASSSSAAESSSAEAPSSSSEEFKLVGHRVINVMSDMEVLPEGCEPNREGYNPAYMAPSKTAEVAFGNKIAKMLEAENITPEAEECLKDIMAHLQQPVMAYGVTSELVLDVKCNDGTTYFSQSTLRYAERYEVTPEEFVKMSEECDKKFEEATQKLTEQAEACLEKPSEGQ
ncbi:MAG: hypothetical protein J6U27_01375 [Spirochaetales bacterium]|nr:hypothetical protein [Spirochaetales bacterium]